MKVGSFVERLVREFVALARIRRADAGAMARLESVVRLTLFDALAAAADEINRNLAQGSVVLRVEGREVSFVVMPPPPPPGRSAGAAVHGGAPSAEEDAAASISVRVSRELKSAIEQAAGSEGRSVDAWLGRLASAEIQRDRAPGTTGRTGKRGRQRYTAWAR